MKAASLILLAMLSTGCTIEVVIREPIPVKEMMLRAGEDLAKDAQRVIIVPDGPTPAEQAFDEMIKRAYQKALAEAMKEQI